MEKQRYLTPAGLECEILRENKENVTLTIFDDVRKDSYEWTTDRNNFEKRYKPLSSVKVFFHTGETFEVKSAWSNDEISQRYLGNLFLQGRALCVHVNQYRNGLMVRNIENDHAGRIHNVERKTVSINDKYSFDEIILTLPQGDQYSLKDVWVYDLRGEWINTIGCKQEQVQR